MVGLVAVGSLARAAHAQTGPQLTLLSPLADDVARPVAQVTVQCHGCSSIVVHGSGGRELGRGRDTLDVAVDLSYAEGRVEELVISGRDAANGSSELVTSVYVESSPRLLQRDRAAVGQRIVDADEARSLLTDANRAFWVRSHGDASPGEQVPTPAAFPICYDARLVRNGVVIACEGRVLVSRSGGVSVLGTGDFHDARADVVSWFTKDGLHVADLRSGQSRLVSIGDAPALDRVVRVALSQDGDVAFAAPFDEALAVFVDRASALSLLRDRLPSVRALAIDGGSVGWLRGDADASVWVATAGVMEQLSPFGDEIDHARNVMVREGWTAFVRRQRSDGPRELVRRDPAGADQVLHSCEAGCALEALLRDGRVVLSDAPANRRYLVAPGGQAEVVGSALGTVLARGDQAFVLLGRGLFAITAAAPEVATSERAVTAEHALVEAATTTPAEAALPLAIAGCSVDPGSSPSESALPSALLASFVFLIVRRRYR